jgi:hypothetical protein
MQQNSPPQDHQLISALSFGNAQSIELMIAYSMLLAVLNQLKVP